MAYRVVFRRLAQRDLRGVLRFVSQRHEHASINVARRILDTACALDVMPNRGSRVPRRPTVRKIVSGHYEIFYRVRERQQLVAIVRIWDTRRNPSALKVREPDSPAYWPSAEGDSQAAGSSA